MKVKKLSLTEKMISGNKPKAVRRAIDSFRAYKKTIGIIDKMNLSLGKKSLYSSSSNSTLNIKIVSNGITSTTEI